MPARTRISQKQADFIQWYTSPASPTYDNVAQSAIKAGYTKSYATSHAYRKLVPLVEKHLAKRAEKVERVVDRSQFYNDLLQDAEKGIAERVRMETNGDTKKESIKQKDQHFVAERIGRDKWSTKTITENHGLITLTPDTLVKLANGLQGAMLDESKPIHADYTVKGEDLIAERDKQGSIDDNTSSQ